MGLEEAAEPGGKINWWNLKEGKKKKEKKWNKTKQTNKKKAQWNQNQRTFLLLRHVSAISTLKYDQSQWFNIIELMLIV